MKCPKCGIPFKLKYLIIREEGEEHQKREYIKCPDRKKECTQKIYLDELEILDGENQ